MTDVQPMIFPSPEITKRKKPKDLPVAPGSRREKGDDLEYINYLRNLFTSSRKAKTPRYDSWNRNYKIVMNRYQSAVFANWAPQPRDSEVYPILSSLVAWMTDQEPDIGFMPSANPNSEYYQWINKISDDLSSVYATNWVNEEYDRHY